MSIQEMDTKRSRGSGPGRVLKLSAHTRDVGTQGTHWKLHFRKSRALCALSPKGEP